MEATAEKPKVAVLGLGILGCAIALRLQSHGFSVSGWTRSSTRQHHLSTLGLQMKGSVEKAVAAADVVLLLLPDYQSIQDALIGSPAAGFLKGKSVLQMGTISSHQSRTLASEIEKRGGLYVEAPVQGSQGEASKGILQIMVGAHHMPTESSSIGQVLATLGQQRIHVGPVGSAAALKLAMNHILAAETIAFSGSLGVVMANDVPIDTFMDVLRGSAMHAKQYDKKLSKMLEHDYANANFQTRHLLKDVDLFREEAEAAGLITAPVKGLVAAVQATITKGFAESDYSAVFEGAGLPLHKK